MHGTMQGAVQGVGAGFGTGCGTVSGTGLWRGLAGVGVLRRQKHLLVFPDSRGKRDVLDLAP